MVVQADIPVLRDKTTMESVYVLRGKLILVTEGYHLEGKSRQEVNMSISLIGTATYLRGHEYEFVDKEELNILRRHCKLPSLVSARISLGSDGEEKVEYLTDRREPVSLFGGTSYVIEERANELAKWCRD